MNKELLVVSSHVPSLAYLVIEEDVKEKIDFDTAFKQASSSDIFELIDVFNEEIIVLHTFAVALANIYIDHREIDHKDSLLDNLRTFPSTISPKYNDPRLTFAELRCSSVFNYDMTLYTLEKTVRELSAACSTDVKKVEFILTTPFKELDNKPIFKNKQELTEKFYSYFKQAYDSIIENSKKNSSSANYHTKKLAAAFVDYISSNHDISRNTETKLIFQKISNNAGFANNLKWHPNHWMEKLVFSCINEVLNGNIDPDKDHIIKYLETSKSDLSDMQKAEIRSLRRYFWNK
ncbi:MAG TPA: hypothetical protein DCL21_07180 [Alphaproteobacteria bacterium]|nr:hypothetical protein [Alphaproteobacteria bacterium]